jgi:Translation initiation factor 1 (eIF-1/SUI1) and related proteins
MILCSKCGLPKELCVCDVLEKEAENLIKVYTKKARFNKIITIIEGVPSDDIESAAKALKRKLACGGTVKNDQFIELQGNHKNKIKELIVGMGYKESNIDII